MNPSSGDGNYSIDPNSSGNPFTVYCDMTTDGGEHINDAWMVVNILFSLTVQLTE